MAQVLSARVRIRCACKVDFEVDLAKQGAHFARCPTCDDVCWVGLEAEEHWTDWSERPCDEDMIAVGVVATDELVSHSAGVQLAAVLAAIEDVLPHVTEHAFDDDYGCDRNMCPSCGWDSRKDKKDPALRHHEGCKLRAALDVLKPLVGDE